MDFKKLEKATKIYGEIKALDAEIIEIDRFAMLVANGEIKSSFTLTVEDVGKKKEDETKVSFDEDGSLVGLHKKMMSSLMMPMWFCSGSVSLESENENYHTLKNELSENATLNVLGVLLCEKQAKRRILLNSLDKLGVSV